MASCVFGSSPDKWFTCYSKSNHLLVLDLSLYITAFASFDCVCVCVKPYMNFLVCLLFCYVACAWKVIYCVYFEVWYFGAYVLDQYDRMCRYPYHGNQRYRTARAWLSIPTASMCSMHKTQRWSLALPVWTNLVSKGDVWAFTKSVLPSIHLLCSAQWYMC